MVRELLLRREAVRWYVLRLQGYGALGHPRAMPVRPWFWKLKEDPLQYLWKRGYDDGANSQNVHLARAAIAPFEVAIWAELQQVEPALHTELTHPDSGVITVVYRLAMEQAQLGVIVRYNSRQLTEHHKKGREWLGRLTI